MTLEEIEKVSSFTSGVIEQLSLDHEEDNQDAISKSFKPMLDIIYFEVAESKRLIFHQYWFDILQIFATIEPLAQCLIIYSTPKGNSGKAYADTLLGALLNLSCLPKTADAPFEFFDKPLQQVTFYIKLFFYFNK